MVLMTEMRLYSRKTPGIHEVKGITRHLIGKKRKKTKRRRLVDDDGTKEDACAALYVAAQAYMKQEMEKAGLEGTLPMSFGSPLTIKKMKKHKRSLKDKSELSFHEKKVDPVEIGEENDDVGCKQVEGEERS
ncbi:unnamed protein product [Peronospora destructor]|uniref:Uncharacterized protein n=1 Tax=Peronospora destructor TaxID=86335 RepID=A0AAV0UU62_9STRA|nr:unnamed protein product [Peronospora destructor]